MRIGKNVYELDSYNLENTWMKTSYEFSAAILYPLDAIIREEKFKSIENLYENKKIEKIFMVSWTDNKDYDYTKLSNYYSRHVVYDSEEEDSEYHKRVLKIINKECF